MRKEHQERVEVLITVKAYPLPSRSYDELVCTAGITSGGKWIRIYPVPYRFLKDDKQYKKYEWLKISLKKRHPSDFRLESYSPVYRDLSDVTHYDHLGTAQYWKRRKQVILENGPPIYKNITRLIEDSQEPDNVSLATFKPTKVLNFEWEDDSREWEGTFARNREQYDLFDDRSSPNLSKLPYKFYYKFEDNQGKISRLMIEDWEIGALYWNCYTRWDGDENAALRLVKKKFWDELVLKCDLHLFLGTTLQFHRRRALNPFVIIGVFYPRFDPRANQMGLFK